MNGMYEYEGSNGLKLLLVPQEGLPVTTCNITYHVGSINEGLGTHGATHFLEHGMFKGSVKFHGDKGMWKLEELGAYLNATTYNDRTNYFEVIESKYLEECVMREADRMTEPLLNSEDIKHESTVVRNEYERGENSSFQHLHKRMMATAYIAHPYHHSTIGYKSDIENVSAKKLKEFHDQFYIPNNATYTFVGSFDPQKIKDMVAKYFGNIPGDKKIPDMYTVEPEQLGERRVNVKRPSRSSILGLGFKACHGLHNDAITLIVLAHLLTNGSESPSSELKKNGVVHDVICSWERMKDPYLFVVWATTNYPTKEALDNAEKHLLDMLMNYEKPSEATVSVAKKAIEHKWRNEMEGTKNFAMAVNESLAIGDAFDVYNRFDVLEKITADDIVRVAKQYLDRNRMTVATFLPGNTNPKPYLRMNYKTPQYDVSPEVLEAPKTDSLHFGKVSSESNGITYTQYKNTANTHILVSMESPVSKYTAKEYVTRLVLAKMLSKGAYVNKASCPEAAISKFLQQNGIQRQFGNNTNGISLQLAIPNKDAKVVTKMVKLMKSEIETPLLDQVSFTYTKNRLIAELNGQSDDVNETASTQLYQNLFAPGDANYRYSPHELVEALEQLSSSDVKAEHSSLLKNALTKLTVLGPELIRTCSLKTSSKNLEFKQKLNHASPLMQRISLPGKTSCTVSMGLVTKPTMDLVVAASILGNGFSGRLMRYVRNELGLTYGIGAKVKRMNGDVGMLRVVATFAPNLLEQGMTATMKVIDQWFTGDVTEKEVETQKTILLGSRNVHFDTPNAIAATVHNAAVDGLGIKYIDNFTKRVKAVSLRSVQAAIMGLDKNKLKTVIAGTFN